MAEQYSKKDDDESKDLVAANFKSSVQDTINSLSGFDDSQDYVITSSELKEYPTRNKVYEAVTQIFGKHYGGGSKIEDGVNLLGFLKFICNNIKNPSIISEKNVASILQNLRTFCDIKMNEGKQSCGGIDKLLKTLSSITESTETNKKIEVIFDNYYLNAPESNRITFKNLCDNISNVGFSNFKF